jgi:hypothetical protein
MLSKEKPISIHGQSKLYLQFYVNRANYKTHFSSLFKSQIELWKVKEMF